MGKPFIVSVHVPKTAGTTLAYILDQCFRRRVMYDYSGYADPLAAPPGVEANVAFIESYFDVLHGHFPARRYFEIFPDAAFIATLRHPVARVISHFKHEMNETYARHNADIISGKLDIVEFTEYRHIGSALTLHLEGRDLREYAALIISERLLQSCQVLSLTVRHIDLEAHFGRAVQLPVLNAATVRPLNFNVGPDLRTAIAARVKADAELYRAAVELLDERTRRLL